MNAIVLAGGLGTRLRPVTGPTPKPLAPLLGRPILEHILRLLREQGFTRVCLALGYGAGEIRRRFAGGYPGLELCFREEQEPLGTAGAVRACRDFIGRLCEMAKRQKRVTARVRAVTNEKYAFRCFLLRLGLIGAEYKTTRKILLRNLSGSAAWRDGNRKEARTDEVSG